MHVSLELAKRTKAEVKPMLKEKDFRLEGDVGLVFPIHMNSLPKPVETFIEKSDFSKVTYLYAVSTHCGIPGKPEHYLNDILMKKNRTLDDYHSVKMINNTPKGVAPKFLMRMNWEEDITKEKVEDMIRCTDVAIEEIAYRINNQSTDFKEERIRGNAKPSLMNKLLWKIKGSPKLEFKVDHSCLGCGLCEKVCLAQRIKVDKNPQWIKEECYYCYACFNFCPEQAISVKHYEKKNGRYHYPSITSEQIANQK